MTTTLFKNIDYLAGDDLQPAHGHVLVQEGRIAYLGERVPNVPADRIVDGRHRLMVPGFINAHTHIAMTLLRGYGGDQKLATWLNDYIWPIEARLSDEDVYWGSLLALLEMTAFGITTFADMYDHMDAVAAATMESGLRANLCRGMIGLFDDDRHALRENHDLFARRNGEGNGRLQVWYGPHATNTCTPDYLKEVAAAARERGTGIHIHVAETKEEFEQIQADFGQTPVALAEACGLFDGPCLIAHGVWLTADDAAILARHGVAVAHNPASNMKLASGFMPIQTLRAHGVTLALGTDGASSNNQLSILQEARLAALIHKGYEGDPTAVTAAEALSMATIGGARALHQADELGSIAVGKAADLVLFDTDKPWWQPQFDWAGTLIYAAQSTDVAAVYAGGRLVYQDGMHQMLDSERIIYEARTRAERLVRG